MKITLNGHELSRRAERSETLGKVLEEIKAEITQGGKLVTGVSVDGKRIPEGHDRRLTLSRVVSEIGTLDLQVEEPAAVVVQLQKDVSVLLKRLRSGAQSLARKFRLGNEVIANRELADFLEDLRLLLAGLGYADPARKNSGSPETVSDTEKFLHSLHPVLDRMQKAQAARDYIALADELEYELPELMTEWERFLKNPLDPEPNPHTPAVEAR